VFRRFNFAPHQNPFFRFPCFCSFTIGTKRQLVITGALLSCCFFFTRYRYKESHLLQFEGFKPAIEACSFDWVGTEITLCSHIARKACSTKPSVSSNKTAQKASSAQAAHNNHNSSKVSRCVVSPFFQSVFTAVQYVIRWLIARSYDKSISWRVSSVDRDFPDRCLCQNTLELLVLRFWPLRVRLG